MNLFHEPRCKSSTKDWQIESNKKRIKYLNPARFIQNMQELFNIRKLINVIYYNNSLKRKSHDHINRYKKII